MYIEVNIDFFTFGLIVLKHDLRDTMCLMAM